MAVTLTVNGSSFSYPSSETDTFWGAAATGWAQAVTNGMLQKAGGSFTLTANVDFGASFGLKSAFFGSRTANPSSAGLLRLANIDTFGFRNAANSGDLLFSINPANDHLLFDGVDLSASSSSGNVVGPVNSTDNAVTRFNGTSGQLIQNSGVVIDDSNNVTGVAALTASGALSFGSIAATPANLVIDAYTRPTGSSTVGVRGVAVSGVIAFTSTSTTNVDITNATVTITTTGRPVRLYLQAKPTSSADAGSVQLSGTSSSAANKFISVTYVFVRGSTTIGSSLSLCADTYANAADVAKYDHPGSVEFTDIVGAGTYTYKLQGRCFSSGSWSSVGFAINDCVLVAYEL